MTAAQARGYGDLAGCAMVLTGRAEAFVEAGVQIWDIAPLKILVEEAGGRFTDLGGRADARQRRLRRLQRAGARPRAAGVATLIGVARSRPAPSPTQGARRQERLGRGLPSARVGLGLGSRPTAELA